MNPRNVRDTLAVSTPDDRTIVVERSFAAPRQAVWAAWTQPELLRQWLIGTDGWVMSTCRVDLRPQGSFRWVWTKGDVSMGISGTYLEIEAPARLVNTESFDERWYEGEARITLELHEHGGRTHTVSTWRYDSQEARDVVLRTAISGVEVSYDRLAKLVAPGDS